MGWVNQSINPWIHVLGRSVYLHAASIEIHSPLMDGSGMDD